MLPLNSMSTNAHTHTHAECLSEWLFNHPRHTRTSEAPNNLTLWNSVYLYVISVLALTVRNRLTVSPTIKGIFSSLRRKPVEYTL